MHSRDPGDSEGALSLSWLNPELQSIDFVKVVLNYYKSFLILFKI